jgi:hypothetical protein
MTSLKYLLLAQILLVSCVAFAGDGTASCELADKSIVARTSSGLAQVSNVGDIQIRCRVPARPFPTKPGGEGRYMLKVITVASQISADGSKKPVPSEVNATGGGTDDDTKEEWVDFYVHIPLESAELDAEAERFVAKVEKSMPSQQITEEDHQRALQRIRKVVYQHRVGHFQVECRILDGDRMIGVAVVELEVLLKGRFSGLGLPAVPPA